MDRFEVHYKDRTVKLEDDTLILIDDKEEGFSLIVDKDDAGMKVAMEWLYRR